MRAREMALTKKWAANELCEPRRRLKIAEHDRVGPEPFTQEWDHGAHNPIRHGVENNIYVDDKHDHGAWCERAETFLPQVNYKIHSKMTIIKTGKLQ